MVEKGTVEAIRKAIETSKQRNFDESVEIAVNLKDVDLSVPKNRIEEEILLPKGRGRQVRIAIFATGELAVKAKGSADMIFGLENMKRTVRIRTKDRRTFHAPVGTKSMSPEDLADNLEEIIKRLVSRLDRGRDNIESAYVKTTMGPAVKIM
ncbi:MAG: hypothetical protein V3V21_02195 [Thermoplasmata archaeon]